MEIFSPYFIFIGCSVQLFLALNVTYPGEEFSNITLMETVQYVQSFSQRITLLVHEETVHICMHIC